MAATASEPRDTDAFPTALQRRSLITVAAAQVLGGAGLAAGVTVGALLAQEMLQTSSLAGLPAALFTLGSAGAAFLVGRISHRRGRRTGLVWGYAAGAAGGAGVVAAAALDSIGLFFAALLVYGAGTATNLQARYAGADLAPPHRRGRAISTVLVATTLGAVAGPNLTEATQPLGRVVGAPALAGPFVLAAAAYGLAALVLWVFLRPDPLLHARNIALTPAGAGAAEAASPAPEPAPARFNPGVVLGGGAMVLTQLVMLAIMTMTPIHMQAHGHDLGATGLVIAVHIAFMYLPSPLTGVLVDRIGRKPVLVASGVTLLAAGLVAAAAPVASVAVLATALALLGLGWNFGLLAGTAMVTDAAAVATRARTQGAVDVGVALAGASGGMLSGVVVAAAGFPALSVGGGVLALAIVPLAARRARHRSD
ncbi:MFS transporter [Streptomonospora litoralis]|uniref:Major Facilitator Superfamily protein n=1 Tax=Streptomonospora litoralis TaxID=2498135 RepID=A0A4P6Q692_9ACTN|nr:MFS transporter [Streptomonospora litoralis]QBI56193.1 Major Facilitator Superfamily protein [Streptomonospora litoralis]